MQEITRSPFEEYYMRVATGKLAGKLNSKINRSAKEFSILIKNKDIFFRIRDVKMIEDKIDLFLELVAKELIYKKPKEPEYTPMQNRLNQDRIYNVLPKYKSYISLMDSNPSVTMDAATEYLKCSPGLIKALVKEGKLREVHIRSRVYFSKEDLLKLYDKFNDK
jgi:hypothetical protein